MLPCGIAEDAKFGVFEKHFFPEVYILHRIEITQNV